MANHLPSFSSVGDTNPIHLSSSLRTPFIFGETNPHLLSEIVAQLKAGHTVLRLGNLTSPRDYIHIQDTARGFMAAALYGIVPSATTVTINLGTQVAYTGEQLLDLLRETTQIDFGIETDPGRLRKVDRPYLAANHGKIKQDFGWSPHYTLQDALVDLWANPDLPVELSQKYRLS